MIAPTLVAEAERLQIIKQQGNRILGRISHQRKVKLDLLKGKKISRYISAAFSSEMAGLDGQHMLDIKNLQENNGSIGHSPSATAYFASTLKVGDEAALSYLHEIMDPSGGVPDLVPFDIFEVCWVLWNFSFIHSWDAEFQDICRPLIDGIKGSWKPGVGIGLSRGYSVPDGDDTAFAFDVLSRFGFAPDISTVLAFEENDHFRTYHYEANSSISVNIHVLGALRQAGLRRDNPSVQKVLQYLRNSKVSGAYWFDKWNLSTYYATSHAIIACAGFDNDLVESSVDWIISSQDKNGGWGNQFTTAEETAYCLQALLIWNREGGKVPRNILNKAATWLKDHVESPYPSLWIGKGLYTPNLVVRSAILSALIMMEDN
jgi:halimadienyl-diphosphate synthase